MITKKDVCVRITRHGLIVAYGENMQICKAHIEQRNSVESICEYCKNHGLKMFYVPQYMLKSLPEKFRITHLIKKYNVHGREEDISQE